jgi:REP element-mobilizing transposase RayT
MSIRPFAFAPSEIFHCFNRGVDKRTIFEDQQDYVYFLKMLRHFNSSEVVGSLKLLTNKPQINPPVTILAYCLLPNHYHLVLQCNDVEGGMSKYMQRVAGGYTMYFNQKYERSGVLFQGKFKANHVDSDEYLKHILAYVGFNNVVHNIEDKNLYRASINYKNDLVRGLASSFSEENMIEVVDIIKEMRSRRQDLVLEQERYEITAL